MILSGLLNKNNIENKIIDGLALKLTWQELYKTIKQESPETVVFTTTVFTMSNDVKTATVAKNVDRNIKTIPINIAFQSADQDYLNKYKNIDFIPYQDFEFPVLNLIQNNYKPKNVKGILYRDKDGKTKTNKGGNLCYNLDDLGVPNHKAIMPYLDKYNDHIIKRKPMTIVAASRGCVNQCTHCLSRYLNPLRIRSVNNVIEELRQIQDLGIKEVAYWDAERPFNLKWEEKMQYEIAKEKIDLTWSCNARSDLITKTYLFDKKVLQQMENNGLHTMKLGADSVSQQILYNMNKNETVEQTERAVKIIKDLDLNLLTYCTLGHRGETKQTMQNTIQWITNVLKPDFTTFSIAVPIKGTVFYDYLKEYGYLNKKVPQEQWNPSFQPPYSYENRLEKEGIADLKAEEMYQISQKGYRDFYLRPSYIFKRTFKSNHLWGDFGRFLYFLRLYMFEPIKRRNNEN